MDKTPIEITSLKCHGMDSATLTVRDDRGNLLQAVVVIPGTETLQLHPEIKSLPCELHE